MSDLWRRPRERKLTRWALAYLSIGALVTGCGASYRYHELSPPFERSVSDWPARGDPPRRILRVETVAGTTYTVRLWDTRADTLVGLVGFEDYTVMNPDTLRLAWSDIRRVEVRERTGNDFRNLALGTGIVVGAAAVAVFAVIAIAFSGW